MTTLNEELFAKAKRLWATMNSLGPALGQLYDIQFGWVTKGKDGVEYLNTLDGEYTAINDGEFRFVIGGVYPIKTITFTSEEADDVQLIARKASLHLEECLRDQNDHEIEMAFIRHRRKYKTLDELIVEIGEDKARSLLLTHSL